MFVQRRAATLRQAQWPDSCGTRVYQISHILPTKRTGRFLEKKSNFLDAPGADSDYFMGGKYESSQPLCVRQPNIKNLTLTGEH